MELQARPVLNGHNKTLRSVTMVNIYKHGISASSNKKHYSWNDVHQVLSQQNVQT